MKTERSEIEPHDRLTRITDTMTKCLDQHPEATGNERCVVLLSDGDDGGLVLHGYENDTDAMVDILSHLKALCEANGKSLAFAPMVGRG